MKLRFAFAGFRHFHIVDLYERVKCHPGCKITLAVEEDAAARAFAGENWGIELTGNDYSGLRQEEFDVLAIGDCYGRRGALAIGALEAGKHVISDKPICVSLDEWRRIRDLADAKGLKVGCMLDLRDNGNVVAARQIVAGEIGRAHV